MQRFSHAVKVAGPAYPAGSRRRLRHANRRWNGSECGFGFLRVVGVIREGPSHDEQTPLIHGHLRVVILLKSGIRRVFHDARLRVGKIVLVALFTQAEQLLDLSSQLRLQLQESLVTDCVVLGGIGMDLGPIQADRSQFQHARLLCEQEHLHEQVLQFEQKRAPKCRQRIVVGMLVAGDEAERHRLIGGPLDLARYSTHRAADNHPAAPSDQVPARSSPF